MGKARRKQCLDDTIHLNFAHDIKHLDLEHDTKQLGLEHDTKLSALDTTLTKAASRGACVVESRASGAWLEALASAPPVAPSLLLRQAFPGEESWVRREKLEQKSTRKNRQL